MAPKLSVALLSGGLSSERDVSLKSGDQVFAALDKGKYTVRRYDPKTDLSRLIADAPETDIALIILHGPFGEDGTVQGLLDLLGIPYQGSGVLGSAIAMDKLASKHLYEKAGIPTPAYMTIRRSDRLDAAAIMKCMGLPMVVKPVKGGSSIGMAIVKTPDTAAQAFSNAFQYDDTILIETFIPGTELTVGVIGNQELEPLPVIEIIPDRQYEFFDYRAKYLPGASREICPARIDDTLTQKAQTCAMMAHRALFCDGYSRTDMILKDRDIFVLETNTIPGMTETSLLPRAAQTAGISFAQLLDKLIKLGLERSGRMPVKN